MSIKFSDKLISGIQHVNQDVVYDISFDEDSSQEECDMILAEVCIDAGRLEMWGHPEAQKELTDLIREHGYDAVLREAMNHVTQA